MLIPKERKSKNIEEFGNSGGELLDNIMKDFSLGT